MLRLKDSSSHHSEAILQNLMNEDRNKQVINPDSSESDVKNPEPKQVEEAKEPCLEDLRRYTLTDDPETNDRNYELVFVDYECPHGISVEEFADTELKEMERLHVYVPMITDALWNLKQYCHNGLSGYNVLSLIRNGTVKHNKSGRYATKKELINYPGKMKPVIREDLFTGYKDSRMERFIKHKEEEERAEMRGKLSSLRQSSEASAKMDSALLKESSSRLSEVSSSSVHSASSRLSKREQKQQDKYLAHKEGE